MSGESASDLSHGIALGAVGVAVITVLAAIAVAFWNGEDPMVIVSLGGVLCVLFGFVFLLHQRRKQDAAANEEAE